MMAFQLYDDGRIERVDWTAPAMEHFDGHVLRRWDAHMFVFRDERDERDGPEYKALVYTEWHEDRKWSNLLYMHRRTLLEWVLNGPPCTLHTDCVEAWESGDPRGREMALACAEERDR